MKHIKHIVIHCSATREGEDFTAEDIHNWHLERGFSGIGYHYVVRLDGSIEKGRPDYWRGAHVKGYNTNTIGIVYIGGLDQYYRAKDTRTRKQKETLLTLLKKLKKQYPNADVKGHRDFSPDKNHNGIIEPKEWIKQCPCFDAQSEYRRI